MPFPSSILSRTLADSQQVNVDALPFRAFQLKVLDTYDKAERGTVTTTEELAELEGVATEATFIFYKTMKNDSQQVNCGRLFRRGSGPSVCLADRHNRHHRSAEWLTSRASHCCEYHYRRICQGGYKKSSREFADCPQNRELLLQDKSMIRLYCELVCGFLHQRLTTGIGICRI